MPVPVMAARPGLALGKIKPIGENGLLEGPAAARRLMALYESLLAFWGPRHWWPGDSPFEVMVGAVLTQNTSWRNVEKAIAALKTAELLDPAAMLAAGPEVLAPVIRSSGYYNLKAARLLALAAFIEDNGGGGLTPKVLKTPMVKLRPALLAVNGLGPETVDSIVLYAAGQPSFVVDLYTRRVMSRHGLAGFKVKYEDLRAWFMRHLPPDVQLYNEYHALLVAVGHHYCGPKGPDEGGQCRDCPLANGALSGL